MMSTRSLFSILIITFLTVTVSPQYSFAQESILPGGQGTPISAHFTVPDGLNEDEKHWYMKFQEGNFLVDGWQDITDSILDKTPEALRKDQKRLLDNLGVKIGTEWCKNNEVRKVDTSKLKEWGKSIKQTAKTDPDNLHSLLVSINNEVDSILD